MEDPNRTINETLDIGDLSFEYITYSMFRSTLIEKRLISVSTTGTPLSTIGNIDLKARVFPYMFAVFFQETNQEVLLYVV